MTAHHDLPASHREIAGKDEVEDSARVKRGSCINPHRAEASRSGLDPHSPDLTFDLITGLVPNRIGKLRGREPIVPTHLRQQAHVE